MKAPTSSRFAIPQAFAGVRGLQFGALIALMLFIPILQAGMTGVAFAIWLLVGGFLAGLSILIWVINDASDNGAVNQDVNRKYERISSSSWVWFWLLVTLVCLIHVSFKVPISQFWLGSFRGIEVLEPGLNPNSASLMSYAKLQTLGLWAFFTVFWSIAYVSSRLKRDQVKWLLAIVLIMGAFEALLGLVVMKGSGGVLGLWQKIYYVSDATGTFINRNHFANFLALCLPLGLCALLGDKPLLMSSWPKLYRSFILLVFVVLIYLAAVASHSRMGLAVTVVAGLSWIVVSRFRIKRRLKPLDWLGFLGSALAVVVLMLWYGVSETTGRALTLADGDERWVIWQNAFDLPHKVWISGIGPGNFSEVYALVKPSDTRHSFYYAHNEYLEFVLEFGVPVSFVLVAALMIWFKSNFRGSIFKDKLGVRAAATCTLFVMFLHSFVDFSLQIPANATYAAVALGLLVNQDLSRGLRRKMSRNHGTA